MKYEHRNFTTGGDNARISSLTDSMGKILKQSPFLEWLGWPRVSSFSFFLRSLFNPLSFPKSFSSLSLSLSRYIFESWKDNIPIFPRKNFPILQPDTCPYFQKIEKIRFLSPAARRLESNKPGKILYPCIERRLSMKKRRRKNLPRGLSTISFFSHE